MSKHPVLDLIAKNSPHLSWIRDNTIFFTLSGSRAYGLETESSDWDYRGVCIPSKEYFLGFNSGFEQAEIKEPDTTIFEITKFFNLLSMGNPNCIDILFTDPSDHIIVSEAGQAILDHKEEFLSKQLKERYIGFAKSQAHRIKNHRKWLLSPMTATPTREEMGLPIKPLIDKNQFDVVKNLIAKKLESWNPDFEPFTDSQKIYLQGKVADILTEIQITSDDKWLAAARTIGLDDNLIAIIKKEKEYENKVSDWHSYQNWKKNRNPKRAELEAKYGFDLKHATQLVRLLRMGKEILETGKVQVKRTDDREELMAIKTGAWSYEKLVDYADQVENEVKSAYLKSTLPNQPNIKLLDQLCICLVEQSLEGR
jgi:predicted nucleotidyltransferase